MKKLLLLISFILILQAEELNRSQIEISETIDEIKKIKNINKGIKRDFYINEYFKKEITKDEAFNALSLVTNFTNEMFYNFAIKFEHDETLAVAQCMNMDIKQLINSYADCIINGLSIKDISNLSSVQLELIKQKTQEKYPLFTKRLNVFSSSIPFTRLIVSKKDEFYNIFFNVSDDFRARYFDYKLPQRTFQRIFEDKKNFEKFLKISLTDVRFKNLQKSFLDIDDSMLNDNSSFLLALNAIRLNKLEKAMLYLDNAYSKLKETNNNQKKINKEIDKIIFWKYQITTDKAYLNQLSSSTNQNLYSLYAKELLNKEQSLVFLERIDELDLILKEYEINRASLLYSIAKVKSNFDASKISKDFKIGIMQLNHKLADNLSSVLDNNQKIDLFSIENNLKLANIHLDNIQEKFKNFTNPLFLSLAYEGNIKYLNTKLKNGLFKNETYFEPYMSLELISNDNKGYLKDILMYKYLYQNHLAKDESEKITLSSIFENLFVPVQK